MIYFAVSVDNIPALLSRIITRSVWRLDSWRHRATIKARLSRVIKMACINFSIGLTLHCEHKTFVGWLEAQTFPKQKSRKYKEQKINKNNWKRPRES